MFISLRHINRDLLQIPFRSVSKVVMADANLFKLKGNKYPSMFYKAILVTDIF